MNEQISLTNILLAAILIVLLIAGFSDTWSL
jgi:hypothetical protein